MKQFSMNPNKRHKHNDGAFWSMTAEPMLHQQIRTQDYEAVVEVLKSGTDVNVHNRFGQTAFDLAVQLPCEKIVKLLLSNISSLRKYPYINSEDGCTPLHKCVIARMFQHIECLHNRGANVNAQNKYGSTPLHCAVTAGSLQAIDVLVQLEAEADARQRDTELIACVRQLLDFGADLDAVDMHGNTILLYSIAKQSNRFIKTLIELGANVDVINQAGYNAVKLALWNGRRGVVPLCVNGQSRSSN